MYQHMPIAASATSDRMLTTPEYRQGSGSDQSRNPEEPAAAPENTGTVAAGAPVPRSESFWAFVRASQDLAYQSPNHALAWIEPRGHAAA